MCGQGRPEETEYGVRILAGEVSDAYLQKAGVQRGYSIVIWRGRHVAEPTELDHEEAAVAAICDQQSEAETAGRLWRRRRRGRGRRGAARRWRGRCHRWIWDCTARRLAGVCERGLCRAS